MLAKIINGRLQYAPRNYSTDNGQLIINFNKNEELMKQYGYKEVIDIRPDYNEKTQHIKVLSYTDEDVITVNYEVVDNPVVVTLEERISSMERQLSDQSTILSEEVNKVE